MRTFAEFFQLSLSDSLLAPDYSCLVDASVIYYSLRLVPSWCLLFQTPNTCNDFEGFHDGLDSLDGSDKMVVSMNSFFSSSWMFCTSIPFPLIGNFALYPFVVVLSYGNPRRLLSCQNHENIFKLHFTGTRS